MTLRKSEVKITKILLSLFLLQTLYLFKFGEIPCRFNDNFICLFSDPDDPFKLTEDTRNLGLVVCRGTSVVLICPAEGMESIPNPFIQQDG